MTLPILSELPSPEAEAMRSRSRAEDTSTSSASIESDAPFSTETLSEPSVLLTDIEPPVTESDPL